MHVSAVADPRFPGGMAPKYYFGQTIPENCMKMKEIGSANDLGQCKHTFFSRGRQWHGNFGTELRSVAFPLGCGPTVHERQLKSVNVNWNIFSVHRGTMRILKL